MARPSLLVLVAIVIASFSTGLASSRPQQPAATFRTDVELITVDVTVLDADGNPVGGLTADDFNVRVDGEPRTIASFEYVNRSAPASGTAERDPAISDNQSRAPVEQVVLVLDTSGLSGAVRTPVLAAANHLLDTLPTADPVGLATIPSSAAAMELSTNRALVRERLMQVGGWGSPPGERQPFTVTEALDCDRPGGGVGDCARMISRVCEGIRDPDERRTCVSNVLTAASALVIELRARADVSLDGFVALLRGLRALEGSKSVVLFSEHLLVAESDSELDQIAALAAESRTRIYVFRPERAEGDAGQSVLRPAGFADRHLLGTPFERMTAQSGGKVLSLSPNPARASRTLVQSMSGYYLLGVETQARDRDGRPHPIDVSIRRSGVSVQARQQFVVRPAQPLGTIPDRIAAAIRDPAVRTALPLSVRTYRIPESASATRVVIAASLEPAAGTSAVGFALIEDAVRVTTSGFDERVTSSPYLRSIVVAPGKYDLKLAALDAAGRVGSVTHPLSTTLQPLGPLAAGDLIVAGAVATNQLLPPVARNVDAAALRVAVSMLARDEEAARDSEFTIEVASADDTVPIVSVATHRVPDAAHPGVFALQATVPLAGFAAGSYRVSVVARQGGRESGRISDRFTLLRAIPAETTAAAPAAVPGRRADPTGPRAFLSLDPLHASPTTDETRRAMQLLRDALAERGFQLTTDPRDAAARITLSGQRVFGAGSAALPRRSRDDYSVVLIRATVSHGDTVGEVRAQNSTSNDPWRSAASEAARAIERWLGARATTVDSGFDLAVPPGALPRAEEIAPNLLPRIREYVGQYQTSFATIVADERYVQEYWQRRLPYPTPLHVTRRELDSEMGFTFFPEAGLWFGFRDVQSVDGVKVPARDQQLQELIRSRKLPSNERFQEMSQASARFNIGPAVRNFNVPLITLLFASPEHAGRASFELLRVERLNGIDMAVVAFRETASPTLINRNGHDRPSRGLLWVDPATGRVHRTDLAIIEPELEARLTTWYAYDERAKSMVPTRMREFYDYVERVDDFVETLATYSNFRRFETGGRVIGASPRHATKALAF